MMKNSHMVSGFVVSETMPSLTSEACQSKQASRPFDLTIEASQSTPVPQLSRQCQRLSAEPFKRLPLKLRKALLVAAGLTNMSLFSPAAQADPAGLIVVCTASGPAIPACAGAAVAVHEVVQALNGKEAVGGNGEIAKFTRGLFGIFNGEGNGNERIEKREYRGRPETPRSRQLSD